MGNFSNETSTFKECSMFPGEPWKCETLLIIKIITSLLSLIGSLFMLAMIALFKSIKTFAQRLILNLTLATAICSIIYLANHPVEDNGACQFLGFIMTYTDWSLLLWNVCMTCVLLSNVLLMERSFAHRYETLCLVVCWVLPILISTLPFIGNNYGIAGPWCWIISSGWRMGIWFVPWLIIMIGLISVYIFIIYRSCSQANTWEINYDRNAESNKQFLMENIKSLIGYPFVFVLCSLFAFINRIQGAIDPENPVFALNVLMVLTSPIRGAAYVIIYCLNPMNKERLTCDKMRMAAMTWCSGSVMHDYQVDDVTVMENSEPEGVWTSE